MFNLKLPLKIIGLLGVCLLIDTVAVAQIIRYMKNNNTETKLQDSADYIREIRKPDPGSSLYNIKDYYLNRTPKLVGKSHSVGNIRFEGQVVSYFSSGKDKEFATYDNGLIIDDIYDYYPNGNLYTIKELLSTSKLSDDPSNNSYAITTCNDSTGKALVVNGTGHYIGFDDGFNTVRSEGEIVNKLKNDVWKGNIPASHIGVKIKKSENDSVSFVENYNHGKLISGTSTDATGKIYTYTLIETEPQFNGGEKALDKFLKNTIKSSGYIVNNGLADLSFVVEKNGELTNFKVLMSLPGDLGYEAFKALKLSPAWIPATQYGRPVKAAYTLHLRY